ncbi:MAG: TlpA disulfide reductase family protein, partial [Bacteroidota bacterium]
LIQECNLALNSPLKISIMRYIIVLNIVLFLFGCQNSNIDQQEGNDTTALELGIWRGTLTLAGGETPFQIELTKEADSYQATLINGDERFVLDEVSQKEDSLIINLDVFGAVLASKIIDHKTLEGKWIRFDYGKPYEVPFQAKQGLTYRFPEEGADPEVDFTGKWEVTFTEEDGKQYPAIGIFEQKGSIVTGTFLTQTGDYRYLEGKVTGREIALSTFDGGHGFLFKGKLDEEETFIGEFWPGRYGYEKWEGLRNDTAQLANPDSLTFLKEGYEKIAFSFPNLAKAQVSLDDEKYKDKVVIVQIFGSWCPNCLDETRFLVPYYNKNKDRGLEIIGLAYERSSDFEKARQRVEKMIEKYDISYDFLIAGVNDKTKASETLPMLNRILAYPTTIFLDRQGKIRKIHTGFNGPGTGVYYEKFVNEFNQFMDKLLEENI